MSDPNGLVYEDGTYHAFYQYNPKGNPVVDLQPSSQNFRDPKVTWYEPGQYWVMTTVVADDHVGEDL